VWGILRVLPNFLQAFILAEVLKTVDALLNDTPCFFKFKFALSGFHPNCI
jgi:hypothetical protein